MVLSDLLLKSGIPFAVAHCNFKLRGADSDGDEKFVRDWCLLNNIVFHTTSFNTKAYVAEWKKGTQETARILRYEWFEELRSEKKYAKIVTAHHGDDNVETLLINLFKGTGIAGLHGILPEQNNIIRPLLFTSKAAIAAYAYKNDIRYREDVSNASDDYLRNAVRRNIIPAIQQWFPDAATRVNESITRFGEAEMLYKVAVNAQIKKLAETRGQDIYIPVRKLKLRQPLSTLCYELVRPYGFNAAQVPQILGLLEADSGHYIVSATHRIIRDRDFLIITSLPTVTTDMVLVEGTPAVVETGMCEFSFDIIPRPEQIPNDSNIACLDADKIEFPLILRKWRTGDYLYPLGMNMKKKKVSKLLIDAKVPIHEKEHTWVLECDKRILWLAGHRLDERFKIKETTMNVLFVKKKNRGN